MVVAVVVKIMVRQLDSLLDQVVEVLVALKVKRVVPLGQQTLVHYKEVVEQHNRLEMLAARVPVWDLITT